MATLEIDSVSDAPWNRYQWSGHFVSLDGTPTDDFTRDDVERLIAFGTSGDRWDGESAGIALLKDGRHIAWESTYGPTGSGFSCDAYGGDADIAFASTKDAALSHISEKCREMLEWADEVTNAH